MNGLERSEPQYEAVRQQTLMGERPYDLTLLPDTRLSEGTAISEPQREAEVLARWQPRLEQLDIRILGIRDVPLHPVSLQVDGAPWLLSPLSRGEHPVPPSVYHRVRAAEALAIPFAYWLWAEELPAHTLTHATPTVPEPQRTTDHELSDIHSLATAVGRSVLRALSAIPTLLRDPLLLGVIETAPQRGVWCRLGAWLHESERA